MSYLILHRDTAATILGDDPIVPRSKIERYHELSDLFAAIDQLRDSEAERIVEAERRGRLEGFAAGHLEGRDVGQAEINAELFRLSMRDAAERRKLRTDVAALAIEVVRRIAGEVGANATVAALAHQAAGNLVADIPAIIRVAPSAVVATSARLAERKGIEVVADATLAPMDCVVETSLGRIHAGLETQLDAIDNAWVEVADAA